MQVRQRAHLQGKHRPAEPGGEQGGGADYASWCEMGAKRAGKPQIVKRFRGAVSGAWPKKEGCG